MINNLFSRSPQHLHEDPAQRALGVAELDASSDDLTRLMTSDPASEVRVAAARRCDDAHKLATAWHSEQDAAVRTALAESLGHALDAMEPVGRDGLIASLQDEPLLLQLALSAGHADTRKAAAARIASPAALTQLAEAAKHKDRGIAKLAHHRLDEMAGRAAQDANADAIIAELEQLAERSGPVVSSAVELEKRWQALDMKEDAARTERYVAAREALQARFAREHDEQRGRAQLERELKDWLGHLAAPAHQEDLERLRAELAQFKARAEPHAHAGTIAQIDDAQNRLARFEQELPVRQSVDALVLEAERLAADTTVDDAQLPARWQAIDRKLRTPELTQRFETALIIVEQRRMAFLESTKQQSQAVRQEVHTLLNAGEQALAGGHLQQARQAVDGIRKLKPAAGNLPKPTTQRIGRLTQQLTELERWESFGQQNARVQLIERAEALLAQTLDPAKTAQEVQKLRAEWKTLDEQHAGVPKALWERFNSACEKAYAPTARFFAEQNAQRKQSRKQREEFIAAAAAHAPTLLTEPRDWRAVERWLRDTEQKWRESDLGSVEPRAWKKLDTELKAALAPVRNELASARDEAKGRRVALIEEAKALAPKAFERDTLNQVKALQARWQEEAKKLSLLQRDERPLWEQFRAACDAVFSARDEKRKQRDEEKQQDRRALEEIAAQLEALAATPDKSPQEIRKAAQELAVQWRKQNSHDPALRGIETRYRKAQAAVDARVADHARAQKAAVWTTLAAKTAICDELDALVDKNESGSAPAALAEQWNALTALPDAWDKQITGRRDAAMAALENPASREPYGQRIASGTAAKRERLLELEIALGLDSPRELQQERLAVQVKQLRDRFKNATATGADSAPERVVTWCAQSGLVDEADRGRIARIFSRLAAKT